MRECPRSCDTCVDGSRQLPWTRRESVENGQDMTRNERPLTISCDFDGPQSTPTGSNKNDRMRMIKKNKNLLNFSKTCIRVFRLPSIKTKRGTYVKKHLLNCYHHITTGSTVFRFEVKLAVTRPSTLPARNWVRVVWLKTFRLTVFSHKGHISL